MICPENPSGGHRFKRYCDADYEWCDLCGVVQVFQPKKPAPESRMKRFIRWILQF